MKTTFQYIAAMVLLLVFASCSNDDPATVVPVTAPTANGFTWSKNGSGTIETAAAASFSTQYKTLIAKDASGATIFEINLDGTTAATYTVGVNNAITFTGVNPYFVATGGSVIMTSNANGKMSGTFQATGSTSGITVIDGTFTNIEVNP